MALPSLETHAVSVAVYEGAGCCASPAALAASGDCMRLRPASIETHARAMRRDSPYRSPRVAHAPHDRASIVASGRLVPVHHRS